MGITKMALENDHVRWPQRRPLCNVYSDAGMLTCHRNYMSNRSIWPRACGEAIFSHFCTALGFLVLFCQEKKNRNEFADSEKHSFSAHYCCWHNIFTDNYMENTELQQKWPELKKKLLEKYPNLTEEELILEIGKEGETLKRLQQKLGHEWNDWRNLLSIMG